VLHIYIYDIGRLRVNIRNPTALKSDPTSLKHMEEKFKVDKRYTGENTMET